MEWQPIEDAPKDGTEILVACQRGWEIAGWNTYCEHKDGWINPSGESVYNPTHWMPLPNPPLAEDGGKR